MLSLLCTPLGWLAVFILLLIFEIITLGLTTVWFAGGAAAAFIASLLHASGTVQIVLFLVISILLLIFTRPVAVKLMNKNKEATNVDSLINSEAVVTEEINNEKETGEVRADGKLWMARSLGEQVIEKDATVRIREIRGVKLIVE